jgi:hypothetical protein
MIVFFLIVTVFFSASYSNAKEMDNAAQWTVTNIKVPVYQEDKPVPFLLILADKARPIGGRLEMSGVEIKWLGESLEDIRGIVATPVAVYDKASKTVSGNEKITYRSNEIDLDGVGFDVDNEKKTLHIRTKVKVLIKGDLSSLKQIRERKKKLSLKSKKQKSNSTKNKGLRKLLEQLKKENNKDI